MNHTVIAGLTTPGPLAGKDLLTALSALAQEHAVALPGGADFLCTFPADLPAGKALWQRLAYYIHATWIGGRFDAPSWAHLCLVQSLQLAWAGRPFEAVAHEPLLPAWLQSTAALGDSAPLSGLLQCHFHWLADPANAAVALRATRLANRIRSPHLILPLLSLMAPRAASDRAVADEVTQGVLALARLAERPEELRNVAQTLADLLPTTATGSLPHWSDEHLVRLGWAALRCMQLGSLRRVVRELLGRPPGRSSEEFLGWALNALMRHEADDEVADLLMRAASALPGSPLIQMRRAKLAREGGAGDAEVEALLAPLDPAAPGYRIAILWLANDLFRAGRGELAARYFELADGIAPLSAGDHARLRNLKIRSTGGPQAPIESANNFGLTAAAPLAGRLTPLQRLLNGPRTHEGRGPDATALRESGALALAEFAAALPLLAGLRLAHIVDPVNQLHIAASQYFRDLARIPLIFQIDLTAAYGSLDFARCAAAFEIIHEHVLALVEFVIGLERPFQGDLEPTRAGAWFDMLRLGCDSALALGHNQRALALARQARQRLGEEAGGDLVRRIEEQCLLATGQLDEARALRGGMSRDADAAVVALRPWPEWVQGLDEQPVLCREDAAVDGSFETVGPDGTLREWPHSAISTSLWRVPVRGARVSLSYGLEAPGGGSMLRPHEWHLAMGEFPYPHIDVLNRSKAAAVLRRSPTRTIDEPVVALANMDALVHRNYYHWTLLILTRVVWALEEGLLDGRRLLVPREMEGWMWSSLADAGVRADRLLDYGKGEQLTLSEAIVLSPLEYASASLLRRLQRRMWRAAGLDPASPPSQDKLLYVTRKNANRRLLVEEQALSCLAKELDFELVAPETLSLLDQVRLFARARGIAGPVGAALTNLAWSQPGTRVLSIFKEEVTLPTFVDLSILLSQRHRWLLGRTLQGFTAVHPFSAPYSVDLDLARRELDWVSRG